LYTANDVADLLGSELTRLHSDIRKLPNAAPGAVDVSSLGQVVPGPVNLVWKTLTPGWIQLIKHIVGHALVLRDKFDDFVRPSRATELSESAQDWVDPLGKLRLAHRPWCGCRNNVN
jgi:hypothetical protein